MSLCMWTRNPASPKRQRGESSARRLEDLPALTLGARRLEARGLKARGLKARYHRLILSAGNYFFRLTASGARHEMTLTFPAFPVEQHQRRALHLCAARCIGLGSRLRFAPPRDVVRPAIRAYRHH